jgi:type I restriction enzyme S subunit
VTKLQERIKGRLGDLLPLKYGKSLPAAVRDSAGSVPVYGSSGVVGSHSAALTNGPVIIVGRKGNVGAVHYSAVPCWPIDTAYFAEQPIGHDPRYYRYLLDSLGLARLDKSTAIPGLSRDDYNAVEVVIHPPEQQAEIVAEIEKQFSRLDEAVANLQRVKANLKRYKASVLKAAVEGRLVETEGGWQQVKLGEIALSVRNGYSHKPDAETGTRIFRISAVRPMELAADDVRFLSGEPADYENFLAGAGDVLFTRYNGSRDYVGVCAAVPAGLPPTLYPDKLIRVRVPNEKLLPAFLVIAASTGEARAFIESMIRTTAGQSGVSGTDIKAIPLSVPSMAEQVRIVAEVDRHISIIREVEAEIDTNLKRTQSLRQATLTREFGVAVNQI